MDPPTEQAKSNLATVRVGILGAADIVRKNIRAISRVNGIEVVALGSRSLAKAQAMLDELAQYLTPAAKACGSYDEVLELPGLHAVYIPLPTSIHVEWVRKAAARGLHILLEKPIAASPTDLDAILTACEQHGVQLMDGTMWTHNPRAKAMEQVIRDKARFGDVVSVHSIFTFYCDSDFQAKDIRFKAAGDALGCLGDLGWYCTRAALWAYDFEPPEYVAAHQGARLNAEGVFTHVGATLFWPGTERRHAVFTCSFDQALTQTLDVCGTQGTLSLRDFAIPFKEDFQTFTATSNHGLGQYATGDTTAREEHQVHLPMPQEAYMWEAFCALVRKISYEGAKPDAHWITLARVTQQVVLAVAESARQGVAIKVSDLSPMSNAP